MTLMIFGVILSVIGVLYNVLGILVILYQRAIADLDCTEMIVLTIMSVILAFCAYTAYVFFNEILISL